MFFKMASSRVDDFQTHVYRQLLVFAKCTHARWGPSASIIVIYNQSIIADQRGLSTSEPLYERC